MKSMLFLYVESTEFKIIYIAFPVSLVKTIYIIYYQSNLPRILFT